MRISLKSRRAKILVAIIAVVVVWTAVIGALNWPNTAVDSPMVGATNYPVQITQTSMTKKVIDWDFTAIVNVTVHNSATISYRAWVLVRVAQPPLFTQGNEQQVILLPGETTTLTFYDSHVTFYLPGITYTAEITLIAPD